MNRVLLPIFIIVYSPCFIFTPSASEISLLLSNTEDSGQAASAGSRRRPDLLSKGSFGQNQGYGGQAGEAPWHLPPVRQLLEGVRAQLPHDPVTITGELTVRKRKGTVTATLGFEMFLNLGIDPATARYTIRDAFGTELEQLTVTRQTGQEPRFEYTVGSQLSASNLPSLFKPIQNTDIGWMDLTLSFLWWPEGALIRTEERRSRPCFVVKLLCPASYGRREVDGQYSKVLLWIDEKLYIVLQAEAYDSDEKLVRRLWVKSFKKINDRWMIKDMEVESFPSTHRTRLRVREVRAPIAR